MAKKLCILLISLVISLSLISSAYATEEAFNISTFVKSVTVQLIVHLDEYSRDITWYQEVDMFGNKGEWKSKYGEWSITPKRIVAAGTGVIIYSNKDDISKEGATYILTNAHVVEPLTKPETLGTKYYPLDAYDEHDLIIHNLPPYVEVKDNARPIKQHYYVLPNDYVSIKHREDQYYEVKGTVVNYDKGLDVALVKVGGVYGLPFAQFRQEPAQLGEEVYMCSAPLGIPFSIDKGRINQINLNLGEGGGIIWDNQIKVDIPAAPGSSGAGIFDINGNLIAEFHGVLGYRGTFIEGGGLAINGQFIREWLTWTGWSFICN